MYLLRLIDLNEPTNDFARRTGNLILTASQTTDLMTTWCGHTINRSLIANDALVIKGRSVGNKVRFCLY